MSIPTKGLVKCGFCQGAYIIGQDKLITNGMGTAYICKACIKKFKAELNNPTPPTDPTKKEYA